MASRTSKRSSIPDEQLPELMSLIEGADSVELKLTVPESNQRSAVSSAGCGSDDDDGDQGASAETEAAPKSTTPQQETVSAVVNISVGDNFYKPKAVTIQVGQSIKWKNAGGVAHTVTSDGNSTVKFDSGSLDPRSVYALKPTTRGELTYYCTIHGKVQSGTITVTR